MNKNWPKVEDDKSPVILCRKAILALESAIAVYEREGRLETALSDLKVAVTHIVTAMATPRK